MKCPYQIVTLCAFILGCGAASSAIAAGLTGVAKDALAKDAVCTRCHNESWPSTVLSIYQTRHGNKADSRTPGCQDCHGPSDAHLKSPVNSVDVFFGAIKPGALISETWPKTPSSAEARSAACLTCHESAVLPRTHWAGSQHESRGVTCTNCHDIHSPNMKVLAKATQAEVCFTCHKTERAQIYRISSHPLASGALGAGPLGAGKMTCTDCHNPHGSTGPKLLVKESVNETCYTCHAERRGPFLWEHGPVVDDCTNCHTPHDSSTEPLLKARLPWLCQRCHATAGHASDAYSAANLPRGQPGANALSGPKAQLMLRSCTNCHSQIHGSNHPSGARFAR